jgi:hypothetical protein
MVPRHTRIPWESGTWIVNEADQLYQERFTAKDGTNNLEGAANSQTKKSGLKVVTLIATPNPVSQVLW